MWDPRSYTDSDFGLDEGEQFEPEDIGDSEIDTATEPHIMTVLGPISPEDLGICQPVEHILIDPPSALSDLRLDDPVRAIEELTSFVTAGGKAIVDSTIPELGRDIVGLFDVARRVPVHIICSTSSSIGTDEMLREIRDGIGPRRIRPGVIQTSNDRESLALALSTSTHTGLPIFVDGIPDQPDLPISAMTIILRADFPDRARLAFVLDAGARIAFAGIGSGDAERDTTMAQLIVDLVAAGYSDRLLISQRLAQRSASHAWGGQPGLVYLLERFTLTLMEAGAEAGLVRLILVENPAAALTIDPTQNGQNA